MQFRKLQSDSEFNFKCVCCGNCCASDLDIFLNPLDVWILRNEKRKPTNFLHRQFLKMDRRPEYGDYPFCFLKMREGVCPFLDGKLCTVHHARPACCRAFPVVQFFSPDGIPEFALSTDVPNCPGLRESKVYTLEEWLNVINFGDYMEIVEFMPELAEKLKGGVAREVLDQLFTIFYDFDELADFPFPNDYHYDSRRASKVSKWMIRKARAIL